MTDAERLAALESRRRSKMVEAREEKAAYGTSRKVQALVRLARRANWNAMAAKRELMGLERGV